MRQVVFEAMADGFSIEEIAEMRKVSPRTIRREVDRTLSERRLDAPERYVHFQVARLNKALRVADAALDRGDLRAIDPMVKVVKELDRYHGLGAFSRAALPAPRATAGLPPPPLRLARAAAPFARHACENEVPQAAATRQTQRPDRGARVRGHGVESQVAAADESDLVTGFAAQGLEIMGRLPEVQAAPDDGSPREAGAEGPSSPRTAIQTRILGAAPDGAPQHEECCKNSARPGSCFVTDSAAQALEITRRLPESQAGAEGGGDLREAGATDDSAKGPSSPRLRSRLGSGGLPWAALDRMRSLRDAPLGAALLRMRNSVRPGSAGQVHCDRSCGSRP
jgi:hypothetical protein